MQTALFRYLVAFPLLTFVAATLIVTLSGFRREGFDLPFSAAALAFGIGALAWTVRLVKPEQ